MESEAWKLHESIGDPRHPLVVRFMNLRCATVRRTVNYAPPQMQRQLVRSALSSRWPWQAFIAQIAESVSLG